MLAGPPYLALNLLQINVRSTAENNKCILEIYDCIFSNAFLLSYIAFTCISITNLLGHYFI